MKQHTRVQISVKLEQSQWVFSFPSLKFCPEALLICNFARSDVSMALVVMIYQRTVYGSFDMNPISVGRTLKDLRGSKF